MIEIPQLTAFLSQQTLPSIPDDQFLRLLHGRGQAFAGLEELNIDILGEYVVLDCYGEQDLAALVAATQRFFPHHYIVWQQRLRGENRWSLAEEKALQVQEGELAFHLRLGGVQNIGLFPDMAMVRAQLQRGHLLEHPLHGEWLNLFSYTGSLSVALLKGGARRVMNVDSRAPFLQWSERNHNLNKIDPRSVMHLKRDAMDFRPRSSVLYDGIICDPPQRQQGSFAPARDYPKLIKRMESWLNKGGLLLLTHNDPMVSRDEVISMVKSCAPALELAGDLPKPRAFQWKDQAWAPTFLLLRRVD